MYPEHQHGAMTVFLYLQALSKLCNILQWTSETKEKRAELWSKDAVLVKTINLVLTSA